MEPTLVEIKDKHANPTALGLLAFGMTTVLLNISNAGIFPLDSMILSMGIFYGGIAQVIAGIFDGKKNNVFGLTAFTSYGLFWLTLVALLVIPKLGWWDGPGKASLTSYFVMWGIFTLCLYFGTLKTNRALQFVFISLTVLFFLLAWGENAGSTALKTFTGWEGIVCGASAIYAGAGTLLNQIHGRSVIPLGTITK